MFGRARTPRDSAVTHKHGHWPDLWWELCWGSAACQSAEKLDQAGHWWGRHCTLPPCTTLRIMNQHERDDGGYFFIFMTLKTNGKAWGQQPTEVKHTNELRESSLSFVLQLISMQHHIWYLLYLLQDNTSFLNVMNNWLLKEWMILCDKKAELLIVFKNIYNHKDSSL